LRLSPTEAKDHAVGLVTGSWLEVDDTCMVRPVKGMGRGWLYALGDGNRHALITHQARTGRTSPPGDRRPR
jgi:hypothetical protein